MFTAWEMSEGVTFPEIDPFEPLAVKFTTLWYSSDMGKKWQSNAVFHTYYLQLRRAIDSFPRMTSNTLDRFRPLMKFRAQIGILFILLHAPMKAKKNFSTTTSSLQRTWKKSLKTGLQKSLSLLTLQSCLTQTSLETWWLLTKSMMPQAATGRKRSKMYRKYTTHQKRPHLSHLAEEVMTK
jgi:hypothetical protein